MSRLTLSVMTADVRARANMSGQQSVITSWINNAIQSIVVGKQEFMKRTHDFSTISGNTSFAVPSNFDDIKDTPWISDDSPVVESSDRSPLTHFTEEAVLRQGIGFIEEGRPFAYSIVYNNEGIPRFRPIPVPDGVYTIGYFYYAIPKTLVNPNDKPDIPERYQHLIVDKAYEYALGHRNQFETQALMHSSLNRERKRMSTDAQQREDKMPAFAMYRHNRPVVYEEGYVEGT